MGWISKLFGRSSDAANTGSGPASLRQSFQIAPDAQPSQPTRTQNRKGKSEARSTSDDPRVYGWVNWNICGWVEVAGIQFRRDDALWAYKRAGAGDVFELKRDPDNPHDSNAIGVWFKEKHVGFIDRGLAARAADSFPEEMPVRAEYISGYHGDTDYVRLTIQPLMPDAKSRKENGWEVAKR